MLMLPYIECYMLTAANCTWYKKYDDSPKASGLSIYEDQKRTLRALLVSACCGRYVLLIHQHIGLFIAYELYSNSPYQF